MYDQVYFIFFNFLFVLCVLGLLLRCLGYSRLLVLFAAEFAIFLALMLCIYAAEPRIAGPRFIVESVRHLLYYTGVLSPAHFDSMLNTTLAAPEAQRFLAATQSTTTTPPPPPNTNEL
jgi:hypothetical protein